MSESEAPSREPDGTILIVVGSDLDAEREDRPTAYRLKRRIEDWVGQHEGQLTLPLEAVVCSDLWYLNHGHLQKCPTICLGDPRVNALSRFLASQLPKEARPDLGQPQVLIQVDEDFTDLRVCVWGTEGGLTAKGADLFRRRYLDAYLRAVATQVEPHDD